jgi:dihydrofolate synthase / folylpolyglutamate synthase
MQPTQALAWLDAHVNLESLGAPPGATRRATHPTLARIGALTALLGSPQLEYPVVHLTGTNGKTSVARLATELLVATGLSTGTYTSPHLERVNERLSWCGTPIDDDTLAELVTIIADVEQHLPDVPSYFEILTGAALRWFADVAVDVAVVEVGLGGRWDATNVVDGRVAVVTNVSIDHTDYLGHTREQIAAEKAGIVTPAATLVLGEPDPTLAPIFTDAAPHRVVTRDADFGVTANATAHGGRLISLFTPEARYDDVFLSLHGGHQADNAAAALTAAECFLDRPLDGELVADVLATTRSPGRLEVIGHQPLVLLDGAHNVAGAHALRDALAEEFPGSPRTLVIGLLREKDPTEMLKALGAPDAARVVCCRPPSPRAHPPEVVRAAATDLGVDPSRVEAVDAVADAVAVAVAAAGPDEQVVVTGSLYVVGAARAALGPDRRGR